MESAAPAAPIVPAAPAAPIVAAAPVAPIVAAAPVAPIVAAAPAAPIVAAVPVAPIVVAAPMESAVSNAAVIAAVQSMQTSASADSAILRQILNEMIRALAQRKDTAGTNLILPPAVPAQVQTPVTRSFRINEGAGLSSSPDWPNGNFRGPRHASTPVDSPGSSHDRHRTMASVGPDGLPW